MSLHIKDLDYLRAGWQKVVDHGQYGSTIYVFQVSPEQVMAVTNKAQGVGKLIETITAASGAGGANTSPDNLPAKGEPANYGVQYEGTGKLVGN